MTPLAGFIAAIVAGWFICGPRRAATAILVPFLVVLGAQTWRIAVGDGTSPPSTVTGWPQTISYWLVQVIILAPALGIAAELAVLRARRGRPNSPAADAGRQAVIVSGLLTIPAAIFAAVYLLTASPVAHHSSDGSPPLVGFLGIALSIIAFAGLGVPVLWGRRAARRQAAAGAQAGAIPAAERG